MRQTLKYSILWFKKSIFFQFSPYENDCKSYKIYGIGSSLQVFNNPSCSFLFNFHIKVNGTSLIKISESKKQLQKTKLSDEE